MNESVRECGNYLQMICHEAAYKAGWWTHPIHGDLTRLIREPKNEEEKFLANAVIAQKLALIHSEVSEALEGHRKNLMDDKLTHRKMLAVELSDILIRVADLFGALELDMGGTTAEKLAFNESRADHKPEIRAKAGGKSY